MSDDKLYKGKFIIAFYEHDDETLFNVFSNTREVTQACGLEVTRNNILWISHKLVRAFRKKSHNIDIFGRLMKAYLIDVVSDDEGDIDSEESSQ